MMEILVLEKETKHQKVALYHVLECPKGQTHSTLSVFKNDCIFFCCCC